MDAGLLVALGIAALLGWAGGELATSRGRDRILGIVLGFVLGLLGLFIVWLLPRRARPADMRERAVHAASPRHVSTSTTRAWTCEGCGTSVAGSELHCSRCLAAASRAL